jgi:hypothetical protein
MKRIIWIVIAVVVVAVGYASMNLVVPSIAPMPMGGSGGRDDGLSYNTADMDMPAAAPEEAARSVLPYDVMTTANGEQQYQADFFEPQQADQKRMVIKNADLLIVVKDPTVKMQAIAKMAEEMGGYVVSSTTSQSYVSDGTKVPEGSMMIRIPAEKLDAALSQIKADVVEVQNDTMSGQDVTKEYTDLSSQLKNLEATEKKLTEIMDKAIKTEDVLAVFNQLTQIRGQIEIIKGQMKYYEQSAAMSAVSVRILADKATQPIEIAGWQPQGDARDAVQALIKFFQGFVSFLIWLVIFFIPVVAVTLLIIFVLWRLGGWMWRKFGVKKSA